MDDLESQWDAASLAGGSSFCSDGESRYALVEDEMLGGGLGPVKDQSLVIGL